jgi:8-oxo-dGTP diphosphatase
MVTVDAVVFNLSGGKTQVLLVNRGKEPYKGKWAVPGGFIEIDEELENAVARELKEETGLTDVQLEQMRAFGRCGRDPRGRQISIAYTGIATEGLDKIRAGDDAAKAKWFDIEELPTDLAFDHDKMIKCGIENLQKLWGNSIRHP